MATKTAGQLIQEARSRIQNLSVEQVAAELAQGSVTLVDIREPAELKNGTIPGSIHVPRGMIEFRADATSPYHDPAFDPSRRIILHCASGGRSALAADTLRNMGYTNIAHLDGGINAWTSAGKPVNKP
jgi:rhodanese-related sulfurtransferase